MEGFVARDDLSSWGRVVRAQHFVAHPSFAGEMPELIRKAGEPLLAVGLMRSYGDCNLNPDSALIAMDRLDRIHFFDSGEGIVRADAGLSLDGLIRLTLPKGWFPPVVPGTRFVTLGGAIANDVHGKNHHSVGTFGRHVRRLCLLRSDGSRHELTPDDPSGLWAATIGGLGLTGIVEWVELALKRTSSAFVAVETVAFNSLDEFFSLSAESETQYEHTVAWIDCTGKSRTRGLFSRGNAEPTGEKFLHTAFPTRRVPMEFPSCALNSLTLRLFNASYFHVGRMKTATHRLHYAPFFFPLDAIEHWNRLYGRQGFFQYQCAVPEAVACEAIADMLREIARRGEGSFLAVLKTFGKLRSPGLLSFPLKGATLALDFRNRGERTMQLLERLDEIVREAGGRLYPAKDGRMSAAMFTHGYGPVLQTFVPHIDPAFSSRFWRRVSS